jgi:uncharacterized membrane protein
MAGTQQAPVPFEAVLYPNPPLGRYGFFVLMLAVSGVGVAVGTAFFMAGAWPVSGFFGLDIAALYVAFRWAQRQSRQSEIIRLDPTGLHVRRVEPDGRARDWRFEPYWVRVRVEDPGPSPGSLTLSSHGQRLRLGQFLTHDERRSLGRALEHALVAYRS